MSTIVELRVPTRAFPGGAALQACPEAVVTLDRVVPTNEEPFPYWWVIGTDQDAFFEALRDDGMIDRVDVVCECAERALYRETCATECEIIDGLASIEATVVEARGTVSEWSLTVRVTDRRQLTDFESVFSDRGISVTVRRITALDRADGRQSPLTPKQRNALALALEEGYFDNPRRISQSELGDRLDVSGRAISYRLRRGMKNLLERTLS
jgi:predicted DNA binding protein